MHLKMTMSALALAAFTLPVQAQQLDCTKSFGFRADVNGTQGTTLCASNVGSFVDSAKNFSLSNSGYSDTAAALAQGRFNDVNVALSYTGGSNTLHYNFTELGISGSFTGMNRDDSEEQFAEFVKKSDILGKVLRYQAQHSAASAITGQGGLIPMLGAADFATGFDTASKIGGAQDTGPVNNLLGVGLGYSSYNVGNGSEDVRTFTLPLSYTVRSSSDPRRQLVLSMPIARARTGDADAFNVGVGAAVRLPLTDNWTITPGARYSIVASKDRATLATVMSGSLMSTVVVPLGKVDLALGNMVGVYKTGKFSSGDYSFDPAINLKMTRNGLMASVPTRVLGANMAAEFSLIDTRYLGDAPYVTNSQEIGVTLGTNRSAATARQFTRIGASYVHSATTKGITVNMGYWF